MEAAAAGAGMQCADTGREVADAVGQEERVQGRCRVPTEPVVGGASRISEVASCYLQLPRMTCQKFLCGSLWHWCW